ncbi:hypothetical protein FQN53_000342 [Emmonsiellopsis sp. PD_33]|nr:hypothetical protein FQN53_000342 [Emmonsiellopsis sp. PD_33]
MAQIKALRDLIYSYPVIDNHAHNILKADCATDYAKYPFEAITSEAQGESLEVHTPKSLAHLRSLNQLAEFYGCRPELPAIVSARNREIANDYGGLVRRSLEGTHMLLIDDGLTADDVELFSWHDKYTNGPTKRIVRIEALAAAIASDLLQDTLYENKGMSPQSLYASFSQLWAKKTWKDFCNLLEREIEIALDDPAVVGFKSVICYRTGLKIERHSPQESIDGFETYFGDLLLNGGTRIENKPLNDSLVRALLHKLSEFRSKSNVSKPVQFHTGLGDSDIDLRRSNPAFLQPLIEEYKDVDFVLLHSSYPYTREAGYLASIYANTYLDIGEVFPMTSRDAQVSILRQSLELVPSSKLLWSTDGHYHPETFWLANKQFRQVVDEVFTEYVSKGDYTTAQAMEAVRDIMFNNSNKLYSLKQSVDRLAYPVPSSTLKEVPLTANDKLTEFIQENPTIEFIWMQWVDYTATVRVRMFPVKEFAKIVRSECKVGITLAVLNMLQNDVTVPPAPTSAGQFILQPDLSSLARNVGLGSNSASVMTFWKDEDGNELEGCPRTTLQNIVDKCQNEFSVTLLVGFEIEVVFMNQSTKEDGTTTYSSWLNNHSWSNMTADTVKAVPMLEHIVRELAKINIPLEQFHAESSPGQFEFILPPSAPLSAVDTLIKTRQTIVNIANQYGLRATLYPRPFSSAAGTAAHTHISITPATLEDNFLAGMLHHLPSILPFTFPQDASYARVKEGIWSGGVWVAWGYQNRETPIRKVCPGHWEIKSMDGLANPYFAVAAIIGAGYWGLKGEMVLKMKGCDVDTATLSASDRADLSISTRMPSSLEESLAALEYNPEMRRIMGYSFVRKYMGVRRGEHQMLSAMSEEERRTWLIARY